MGLLPFDRWISGMILILAVYLMYGGTGHIVENELPQAAEDAGVGQWGTEVINNLVGNFWYGILIMIFAGLLLIFVGGLPGQQEERRYV